jgi:hypothetical protein
VVAHETLFHLQVLSKQPDLLSVLRKLGGKRLQSLLAARRVLSATPTPIPSLVRVANVVNEITLRHTNYRPPRTTILQGPGAQHTDVRNRVLSISAKHYQETESKAHLFMITRFMGMYL